MLALPDCYFTLFQLSQSFDIDLNVLEKRYEALAARFHPDNFSDNPHIGCQISLLAAKINDAYQVLKCPLNRAAYLLSQGGYKMDSESIVSDPSWLMRQFEWREQIAQATAIADSTQAKVRLAALRRELKAAEKDQLHALSMGFAEQPVKHPESIATIIQQLQFISKAIAEIS